MTSYQYLFGPAPSRRLGRSLGVDLTPYKTCCFDCVFCQLGRTRKKTLERRNYVPVDRVIAEIESWLKMDGRADWITLSGSGEPTLHAGFGEVLRFLKTVDIPSAILTNGSTLTSASVREAARLADVVKVSLSAWDRHSFEMINRPHPDLRFEAVVEGQKKFREIYDGQLWVEVFVLYGMNSAPEKMKKIAALAREIEPDRIHLNTVARPPAEDFAVAPPEKDMLKLTGLFDPPAEIVAEFKAPDKRNFRANEETVLSMLRRRPCTIEQIAKAYGMHLNEASKYLGILMRADLISAVRKSNSVFYTAKIVENETRHDEKPS